MKINRKEIAKKLQLNGFMVQGESITIFENELINGYPPYESLDIFINKITKIIVNDIKPDTSIIDTRIAEATVAKIHEKVEINTFVNEFLVKNINFENQVKTNEAHRVHYNLLLKSILSHPAFKDNPQFQITKIDNLLTTRKQTVDCIILGFIKKQAEKIKGLVLQDPSGEVPVIFNDDTQWHSDLVIENSFVIVEGVYYNDDDYLLATKIGNPFFSPQNRLMQNEIRGSQRMVVILRDVYLDCKDTFEKMKTLFIGYSSVEPAPYCFIIIGDLWKDCDQTHAASLIKKLLKLYSNLPNLEQNTHLVFAPSVSKTDRRSLLRAPLENSLFPENYMAKLKIHLATNPCHIYLNDCVITLFSNNSKFRLKNLIIRNETMDAKNYFKEISSIICTNAYLAPGIDKHCQSSLSLWRLPNLLIYNDVSENNEDMFSEVNGIQFTCIPSFTNDDFRFKVFYLNNCQLEDSQILV